MFNGVQIHIIFKRQEYCKRTSQECQSSAERIAASMPLVWTLAVSFCQGKNTADICVNSIGYPVQNISPLDSK